MKLLKQNLANVLTLFRMLGSVLLLFVKPFGGGFFALYTLCGVSDGLDGTVARMMGNPTEKGAVLDSISDLFFYAVMLFRLFPFLKKEVALPIWIFGVCVLVVRAAAYLTAAVKYCRFASLHTYGNKITGVTIFLLPYLLMWISPNVVCGLVCTVAAAASLEELSIHLMMREYRSDVKTAVKAFRIRNADSKGKKSNLEG